MILGRTFTGHNWAHCTKRTAIRPGINGWEIMLKFDLILLGMKKLTETGYIYLSHNVVKREEIGSASRNVSVNKMF